MSKSERTIVIVSGLPRSGTSMMMRMLDEGGLEPMTDGIRQSDEDNPKGYYEVEQVKSLKKQTDKTWVRDAEGKVLKVVSSLLKDLPTGYRYDVVFMNRNLDEVVASQNKMIERRGEKASGDDKQIRQLYEQHLRSIKAWIPNQPNFRVLEINYTDTISDAAGVAKRIKDFLGLPLDVTKMAGAVDEQLYRNRAERS
jgi:sulfotransferase family protein